MSCRARLPVLVMASALVAAAAQAAPAPGDAVSFIACPIARDTGPETDLCFFAEHRGERFALLNPPDTGGPELGHKVLVEGVVTDKPRLCGGLQLEGRFTPLRELSPECNVLLPFDGKTTIAAGSAFSVVQRRTGLQELAERAEREPAISILPVTQPPAPAPPLPPKPYPSRSLTLDYLFDSDRGQGPQLSELIALVDYAKAIKAQRLIINTRRAASRLDDGQVLTETEGMGRRRADKLTAIISGLGFSEDRIVARVSEEPPAPDGRDDWRARRAVVTVEP